MIDKFLDIEIFKFAEKIKKLAKINVGATFRGKRIDTTGKLRESIDYDFDKQKNKVGFKMEDYGVWVDSGRDGKNKKNRGKGLFKKSNAPAYPPIDKIKKWINDKPIKPRDLKSGRFVQKTQKGIDQMAFLISRKIYNKGIKATLFFTNPFEEQWKEFPEDVIQAFALDLEENLKHIQDGSN